MPTLKQLGEREVIRRLARRLPTRPDVRAGIGHDVAVVAGGGAFDWLLKSDAVIEGRHFLPDTPARRIGHKAVGRVLSDLAAAGGEPLWALVNLVAPAATGFDRVQGVYRGLAALARRHGLAIVGGDTAEGPVLELHVFAVGRAPRGTALLRSGARPGDRLYVTGALGGSRAGRHLRFAPRVAEGQWLRAGCWATAAIDLSDGLATDLGHIVEMSRVGAELFADKIPIARAIARSPANAVRKGAARRSGRTPLAHALCDGEDFELLFTVPARRAAAFETAWRKKFRLAVTCIGAITRRSGRIDLVDVRGRRAPLRGAGFEHFA